MPFFSGAFTAFTSVLHNISYEFYTFVLCNFICTPGRLASHSGVQLSLHVVSVDNELSSSSNLALTLLFYK